jgi:putative hydrolase of the HAD superfamily
MEHLKVIAFDADDTLWINEPFFQDTEAQFAALLENYATHHAISKALLSVEIQNLPLYGYGAKSFMLSMIETSLRVTDGHVDAHLIGKILDLGKQLIERPIELLDGVRTILDAVAGKYTLVVATKGDLLDQERKLKKSGIEHYFHHVEIMSEKAEKDYEKLLRHLDIEPSEFLMIGNSVKSDILPVLNLGGYACHVPYHTTWALEVVDVNIENERFRQVASLVDLVGVL